MNAANHTPGPWSCDYGDFSVFCSTGAEVAGITRGNHDDGTAIPDREMEMNMRLVAAAPELLAACALLVALEDSEASDFDTRWRMARRNMRDAVRKAIA
jgi:hypothetical protein